MRVFIEHGDRTDRKKARLKYVLDDWGLDKFLAEVEKQLRRKLDRASTPRIVRAPRRPTDRCAHVGVHPQKQPGLNYVGVVLPVGRMTCRPDARRSPTIAERLGDGDIRLTVWQNLLISDIPDAKVEDVKARDRGARPATGRRRAVRAGLVACTGNARLQVRRRPTPRATRSTIADHLEARLALDQPVNIHLTGCHHSCAQHYIGDIGLLGAKVAVGEDDRSRATTSTSAAASATTPRSAARSCAT